MKRSTQRRAAARRRAAHMDHSMEYQPEYIEGFWAPDDSVCPYGIATLGRFCAWRGGYHDARRAP